MKRLPKDDGVLAAEQIREQQMFDMFTLLPEDMRRAVASSSPQDSQARLMQTSHEYRALLGGTQTTRDQFYDTVVIRGIPALHNFLLPTYGESTSTIRRVRELYVVLDAPHQPAPWMTQAFPSAYIKGLAGIKRLFFLSKVGSYTPLSEDLMRAMTIAALGHRDWTDTVEELVVGPDVIQWGGFDKSAEPLSFPALKRLHLYAYKLDEISAWRITRAPKLKYATHSVRWGSDTFTGTPWNDVLYGDRILNRYVAGKTAQQVIADATRLLQDFPKNINLDKVALMPVSASLAVLDQVFQAAPPPVVRAIQNAFRKIPWAACGASGRYVSGRLYRSELGNVHESTINAIRARFLSHPWQVALYAPVCASNDTTYSFDDYMSFMAAGSMLVNMSDQPPFTLTRGQMDAIRFLARRFPDTSNLTMPYLATVAFNNPVAPTHSMSPEDVHDITAEWICALAPIMRNHLDTWGAELSSGGRDLRRLFDRVIGVPLGTLTLKPFPIVTPEIREPPVASRPSGWKHAALALRFFRRIWNWPTPLLSPADDNRRLADKPLLFDGPDASRMTQLIDDLVAAEIPLLIRASRRLARRAWGYLCQHSSALPTVVVMCAMLAKSGTSPTSESLVIGGDSELERAAKTSHGTYAIMWPSRLADFNEHLSKSPGFIAVARAHRSDVRLVLGKLIDLLKTSGAGYPGSRLDTRLRVLVHIDGLFARMPEL